MNEKHALKDRPWWTVARLSVALLCRRRKEPLVMMLRHNYERVLRCGSIKVSDFLHHIPHGHCRKMAIRKFESSREMSTHV